MTDFLRIMPTQPDARRMPVTKPRQGESGLNAGKEEKMTRK
jgi:hypothetical protein